MRGLMVRSWWSASMRTQMPRQPYLQVDMAATVAQNPTNMGALGIESVLNLINGETLEPVIDTGTVLVTAENAADYQ